MGSFIAGDLAALVAEETISLEKAVEMHLRSNHYPPLPYSMVQPALQAIEMYKAGEVNETITLPEGMSYRDEPEMPVLTMIEVLHLEFFLPTEE